MRDALAILFKDGIRAILRHLHRGWGKAPNAEKARWARLVQAMTAGRQAELVRLAHGSPPTVVPGLIRPPVEERFILSMPVYLYESRSTTCLFPAARRASRKLVWEQRSSSGRTVTISLVDRGTLDLTERRLIFTSTRRRREYPLDELTHFSTAWSGIALATLGWYGVSYFRGIKDTRMRFRVFPKPEDKWTAENYSFNFTGNDIKEVVSLLQSASTPTPA